MHTDPLADLLTRIRNAGAASHETVAAPYSTLKENVLKVLKEKGFIEGYVVETEDKFKTLVVTLKEDRADLTLTRISTPGQRIYTKSKELKTVRSGLGITIVSTPRGVMTNTDAYRQNLGGEVLCEIY